MMVLQTIPLNRFVFQVQFAPKLHPTAIFWHLLQALGSYVKR
jgi:hypothetical protein